MVEETACWQYDVAPGYLSRKGTTSTAQL